MQSENQYSYKYENYEKIFFSNLLTFEMLYFGFGWFILAKSIGKHSFNLELKCLQNSKAEN